eukprot:COSAG02_NODE_10542_length_1918_cov_1.631666_3_plen_83_part_00
MRIIEKRCREGDSAGPAPVVNSPGPAHYTPAYVSPNKSGVGATADKIEKQLSTTAGRLRESQDFTPDEHDQIPIFGIIGNFF